MNGQERKQEQTRRQKQKDVILVECNEQTVFVTASSSGTNENRICALM